MKSPFFSALVGPSLASLVSRVAESKELRETSKSIEAESEEWRERKESSKLIESKAVKESRKEAGKKERERFALN